MTLQRREFITLLSGAAAWPVAGRAQQPKRVGVLTSFSADDAEGQQRVATFKDGLEKLGWVDGRNIRIDTRWAGGDPERLRINAAELAAFMPDAILVNSTPALAALKRETVIVPIVFVNVVDPIAGGFVASLARPGGNITGFTNYEHAMGGKWLETLKETAPDVTRVLFILNPKNPDHVGLLAATQAVTPSFRVAITPALAQDGTEIERAIDAFAREPHGGILVEPDATFAVYRERIVSAAARNHLPAVYPFRYFVTDGGLISYGVDTLDIVRRAAAYIDRILRGDKPAELPVQAPVKFELVINLKTAKALNLAIPPTLLALADEVIE